MRKHTPGPWRVGERFTDDEGHPEIAVVATVNGLDVYPATVVLQFPRAEGMQEANAHLIAAAPELLDAAAAAIAYDRAIQQCANDPAAMSSFCTAQGDVLDALYFAWISKAQAAVAKANGEEA